MKIPLRNQSITWILFISVMILSHFSYAQECRFFYNQTVPESAINFKNSLTIGFSGDLASPPNDIVLEKIKHHKASEVNFKIQINYQVNPNISLIALCAGPLGSWELNDEGLTDIIDPGFTPDGIHADASNIVHETTWNALDAYGGRLSISSYTCGIQYHDHQKRILPYFLAEIGIYRLNRAVIHVAGNGSQRFDYDRDDHHITGYRDFSVEDFIVAFKPQNRFGSSLGCGVKVSVLNWLSIFAEAKAAFINTDPRTTILVARSGILLKVL